MATEPGSGSGSGSLPFRSVGFILRADKEADLPSGRGDALRPVLGRRRGDLPVAAVEVQAGQGRDVVSLQGAVAVQGRGRRAQTLPQTRLTVDSTAALSPSASAPHDCTLNTRSHLRDPAAGPLHACRYTSPATPNSQLTSAGTSGIHSRNLVHKTFSLTGSCRRNPSSAAGSAHSGVTCTHLWATE